MVVMILGSGFEPVEAIAPCDILRRGGVEVQLAGIGGRMVEAGHGVTVQADCTIEEADFDRAEMVVLPGGLGGVRSILGCKAATVLMPISRQARWMRRAISPRLAIRIFPNIATRADYSMMKSDWPNSTGWPFSTQTSLTVPSMSASTSLRSFMASMMQTTWPFLTVSPTLTKGSAPGEGAR